MKTITKSCILFVLAFAIAACSKDDGPAMEDPKGENPQEKPDEENPEPQYNLDALQGKWYRAYSNNPDSDGMEVTVTDDQGEVTTSVGSDFPLNSMKWKDIIGIAQNEFEHKELGSDSNYYDASMDLSQDDTLRIYVGHSAAGNAQKWVRTYTEPEPEPEIHECEPYEPDSFTGSITDNWSEPNENDVYPGLLPASTDPAGGYYIVTLQTEESTPWIDINIGGHAGTIINGSNGTTDNTTRKVAFSAHPGISYDVMVSPFHNGSNFPEAYTISWEYVGIMDCYEPNNDFDEAKFIPKNEIITAFMNRGYEGYAIQEEHQDYYKVVLTEPSKIQVELLQSPSDHFISIAMFTFDESSGSSSSVISDITLISGNANSGESGSLYMRTSNRVREPGTYYFRMQTSSGSTVRVDFDGGESLPDVWLTPYKFKVTAVE
jgi:hypothetical protein